MKNNWKIYISANGELSIENASKSEIDIENIENNLKQRFADRLRVEHIMISWDCWSGIFIMQNVGFEYTKSTELLLQEIYDFLRLDDMIC